MLELVISDSTGSEVLRSRSATERECRHCGALTPWVYSTRKSTDLVPMIVGPYCTSLCFERAARRAAVDPLTKKFRVVA